MLSTEHQKTDADRLAATLGGISAGVFAGAVMHTPVEVTEKAVDAFRASGATAVVSLGGGSTIGLGKAIAVRTGADQVVIPTTYAGSEMTDILGETAGGEKTTRRSPGHPPGDGDLRRRPDARPAGRPDRHIGDERHRPRHGGASTRPTAIR